MESKKDKKVALNDELLDNVSGGEEMYENPPGGSFVPIAPLTFPSGTELLVPMPLCPGCGGPLNNGICIDPTCSRSPLYEYGNDIVIHDSNEVAPPVRP